MRSASGAAHRILRSTPGAVHLIIHHDTSGAPDNTLYIRCRAPDNTCHIRCAHRIRPQTPDSAPGYPDMAPDMAPYPVRVTDMAPYPVRCTGCVVICYVHRISVTVRTRIRVWLTGTGRTYAAAGTHALHAVARSRTGPGTLLAGTRQAEMT